MREYVEKVAGVKSTESGADTKSPVAGKNDMGGTAANILGSKGEEKGGTGAKAPKVDDFGNVNTPGSKNATKMSKESGAANKESGAGNTDSIFRGRR
jgi:hypothetical protein